MVRSYTRSKENVTKSCPFSGGLVLGTARWSYNIFQSELRLMLEAFRYGDCVIFEQNPVLDDVNIVVRFKSTKSTYNKTENWGTIGDFR